VRDGLVDTSTLFSRDSSVVDYVHAAPTAILGGTDATLAIGINLARIINSLSLQEASLLQWNLVGNKLENLLSIPLADGCIRTFEKDEDARAFQAKHSIVKGCRCRCTNSSNSVSEDGHFGRLVDTGDTLDDTLRGGDPEFVKKGCDLAGGPDGARGRVNSGHGSGEGSIPLSFNVTETNLETTVVANEIGGSVVVRNTAGLANVLGRTVARGQVTLGSSGVASVGRRGTLGVTLSLRHTMFGMFADVVHFVANVSVALTLSFATRLVGTMSRSGLVALVGGLVAKISRGKALSTALCQWYTLSRSTARNTLVVRLVANVTVASLVLVVLGADPFLEARRRVVRVFGLSSAVRTFSPVFISDIGRTPTTALML